MNDMDNFIRDLIGLDHRARERLEQAERERDAAKAQISRDKEHIYKEQLARAQESIEAEKRRAQEDAQRQLADMELRFSQASATLEEQFAANREQWVEEILTRCLTPRQVG